MSKVFHVLFFFFVCLNNPFAQQKIIWSDLRDNQIQIANLDGSDKQTIIAGNDVFYHAIDAVNQKLYWSDAGTHAVHRMNLDGTEQEVVISGLDKPQGICLDGSNHIFLIDLDRIVKYSTEGAYLATIHDDLFNGPLDIAINGTELFWISLNGEALEKSNLDGAGRTTIGTELIYPRDLEIDPVSQKLYWTQVTFSTTTRGIYRMDLNGENRERVNDQYVRGVAIDAENQVIYWTNPDNLAIARASLDNPDAVTYLVDELFSDLRTVTIDKATNQLFFVAKHYADFLFRADLETGENFQVVLSSPVYHPERFQVDTLHQKIYWVNTKDNVQVEDETVAIMRANLDGSYPEKLVAYPEVVSPFDLVLDLEQGHIYWTDYGLDHIARATLDGTEITPLVASGMTAPGGIALDLPNEKIYWTDFGLDKIQRANLDGSNVEDLITEGLDKPFALAISAVQGKMYWTDYNLGSLNKADLDGTNVESIITTDFPASEQKNSLFLDEVAQKVYYSVGSSSGKIKRANFDGTDIEEVNLGTFYGPSDMMLVSGAVVGIEDVYIQANATRIFPNPFSQTFTVENPEGIHLLTIYNALGQVCKDYQFDGQQRAVLSAPDDLKKGVYCVAIRSASGKYETQFIVKE